MQDEQAAAVASPLDTVGAISVIGVVSQEEADQPPYGVGVLLGLYGEPALVHGPDSSSTSEG